MSKKSCALALAVQKINFWGVHFRMLLGNRLKKFERTKLRCSSKTSHKNLISIFCGLGEERIQDLERK